MCSFADVLGAVVSSIHDRPSSATDNLGRVPSMQAELVIGAAETLRRITSATALRLATAFGSIMSVGSTMSGTTQLHLLQ